MPPRIASPPTLGKRACPRFRLTRTAGRLISASLLPIAGRRDAHGQPDPHGACRGGEFSRRHGDFGQLMPDSGKNNSRGRATARSSAVKAAPISDRVRDLAWAGQHAQAIDLATKALAANGLSARKPARPARPARRELHRPRRSRSRRQRRRRDARACRPREIERPSRRRRETGSRWCRCATGEFKAAVASATAARKAARQSRQGPLEAMSLFRLAEAQFRIRADLEQAARNAVQAAELFRTLGRLADEGRARWVFAMIRSSQGHAVEGVKRGQRRVGAMPAGRRPIRRRQRAQHAHVQ